MNILMFKYIWGLKRDKIARKSLIRLYDKGGLGMIDIQTRRKADIITQIINVPQNLEQPWACLYVYWFGFLMKHIHPRLADNKWVHTLNIPSKFSDIKTILLDKQLNLNIWQINTKLIYNYLISQSNYVSKTEKNIHKLTGKRFGK